MLSGCSWSAGGPAPLGLLLSLDASPAQIETCSNLLAPCTNDGAEENSDACKQAKEASEDCLFRRSADGQEERREDCRADFRRDEEGFLQCMGYDTSCGALLQTFLEDLVEDNPSPLALSDCMEATHETCNEDARKCTEETLCAGTGTGRDFDFECAEEHQRCLSIPSLCYSNFTSCLRALEDPSEEDDFIRIGVFTYFDNVLQELREITERSICPEVLDSCDVSSDGPWPAFIDENLSSSACGGT